MKKVLFFVAAICLVSSAAFAGPFDKFNDKMNSASDSLAKHYLNNLASDMSAVMTGGNYGVSIGLGTLRFSASAKINAVNVDNEIMRADGTSTLVVPMINAALGLPYDFELLAKYGYLYGTNIYGAGLRYNVYDSDVIFIPSVTVQGVYTMANVRSGSNKLDANNLALGAIATFPVPYVTPYVGLGWDRTKVKDKSSIHEGMTGSADGFSYGFGVSVSILMINGNAGVTYTDGVPNYTLGLNVGF
ncbi:MAG: hypothetical protein II816_07580 [Elusimicrobia bacterium]|nr:hypothetical protein [Elusimicrobiota bacterium]